MARTLLMGVPDNFETALVDIITGCRELELVRRCADLPELLSAAAAGLGRCALVSTGLTGLDRTAIADLTRSGLDVIGVSRPGVDADERLLRSLGLTRVIAADSEPADIIAALTDRPDPQLTRLQAHWADDIDSDVETTPAGSTSIEVVPSDPAILTATHDTLIDLPTPETTTPDDPQSGIIVAVWGPAGSPGRSSIALTLAAEAARLGVDTLLIDADPYGGTQAQALSVLDEAPGLAGAVRSADHGDLDVTGLRARTLTIASHLSLLTGIPRADRWPELRADPLDTVLRLSRQIADLVVLDCGFSVEDDEELSYDTTAPQRNAATLTGIAAADHLIVVGGAEPTGLQRLVRGLQELGTIRTPARRTVLVNRVRTSAVGPHPEAEISAVLARFAGVNDVHYVPDDRDAFDLAALHGRTLAEIASHSPVRPAVVALAAQILDRPEWVTPAGRRRRWR
ncbi:hypothetical protein KEM60_03031 [Austwickia sp. TVS 96-490-7B]|uniref:hypothetical protein n=1 Tax=Austwickia sp. TVS 96-490-7B TaxID=2830843 RepID=UPI001C59F517|nr:hypothetical protein [Austwickia sp. TVS 96-490-7B]MBW3086802.1 hypothetical protein [Austwickia sp. TVS 96-490-7B]